MNGMSTACSEANTRTRGKNRTGARTPLPPIICDAHWLLIAVFFADPPRSAKGGRPRVEPRKCLEGVLWVLQTGARWKDLPPKYPSPSTCWRRLQEWTENGVFQKAWDCLLGKLLGMSQLDLEQFLSDATFSPAKKGVQR